MWAAFIAWLKKVFPAPPIQAPIAAPVPIIPSTSSGLQAALSCELPCNDGQVSQGAHPERKQTLSIPLFNEISAHWSEIIRANDIKKIIPDLDSLSPDQAKTCFAELMSTVMEYECSWDPSEVSVDVNGSSLPKDMATGCFQMNEQDQITYHSGTGFNYTQLKDPANNIKAGIGILVYLVKVRGQITFLKAQKSSIISYFYETLILDTEAGFKVWTNYQRRYAKLIAGFKVPAQPVQQVATPVKFMQSWILEAMKMIGWTEFDHDKELSVYWKWTNVPGYTTVIGSSYAWCALFVGACLELSGIRGSRDAGADSYSDFGKPCPYWFGAILPLRHVAGGRHVTFFLYWIDESNKIAAVLGGNQQNAVSVARYDLSGNAAGHDEVVKSPRWPISQPDGQSMSQDSVLSAYPQLKVGAGGGSTT